MSVDVLHNWQMPRRARYAALLLAGAAAAGAWWQGGCAADPVPCAGIPRFGCPTARGGSCDDAACRALYECVDGAWELLQTCPVGVGGGDAGSGGDGQAGAAGSAGAGGGAGADATAGAGGCGAVELDHSGEVTGCMPDLLVPDCPAIAAESCQPCLTGCADFFMCMVPGWIAVAYCSDDGTLVVDQ